MEKSPALTANSLSPGLRSPPPIEKPTFPTQQESDLPALQGIARRCASGPTGQRAPQQARVLEDSGADCFSVRRRTERLEPRDPLAVELAQVRQIRLVLTVERRRFAAPSELSQAGVARTFPFEVRGDQFRVRVRQCSHPCALRLEAVPSSTSLNSRSTMVPAIGSASGYSLAASSALQANTVRHMRPVSTFRYRHRQYSTVFIASSQPIPESLCWRPWTSDDQTKRSLLEGQ